MYKDRTCRLAIRSVRRRPSLSAITLHLPRPTVNAVPDPRYMRCALCARWAGPRYN